MRVYQQLNVLDAARERVRDLFRRYGKVVVSVSGGKDSTVLAHLVSAEASHLGRTFALFFLDQEAEYAATVDQMRFLMALPAVEPLWYQVPLRMTNATSYEDEFLHAWGPGEAWMREKEPNTAVECDGAPDRFYKFFPWFESRLGRDACSVVGLRSEESLNRYRAVTRNPGAEGIPWSSKGKGVVKYYPLYDWTFEDIWAYIARFGVQYNKVYDWLYIRSVGIPSFRVSNLIHEKSFACLAMLQEFEPDTYDALCRRIKGIKTAARYAKEKAVFRAASLPPGHESWQAFRDFLLQTIPDDHRRVFVDRFARKAETEGVCRQQARQLVLNDWENNIPVVEAEDSDPLEKWRAIL